MAKKGRKAKAAAAIASGLTTGLATAKAGSLFGPIGAAIGAAIGTGLGVTGYLLAGVDKDQQQDIIEGAQTLEKLNAKKTLTPKERRIKSKLIGKFPILEKNYAEIASKSGQLTPKIMQKLADVKNDPNFTPELQEQLKQIQDNVTAAGPSGLDAIKGNAWEGYKPQEVRFNRYSDQQIGAQNQLLQQAMQGLGNNQFDFAPIEQQARRDFSQKTIPSIAERFTAAKGQRSSAFPQILGQAGKDLDIDLAAMKQGYNLEQQNQLRALAALGLQPQFSSVLFPGQQGARQGLINTATDFATPDNLKSLLQHGGGFLKDLWSIGRNDDQGDQQNFGQGQQQDDGQYNGAGMNASGQDPYGIQPHMNQLKNVLEQYISRQQNPNLSSPVQGSQNVPMSAPLQGQSPMVNPSQQINQGNPINRRTLGFGDGVQEVASMMGNGMRNLGSGLVGGARSLGNNVMNRFGRR